MLSLFAKLKQFVQRLRNPAVQDDLGTFQPLLEEVRQAGPGLAALDDPGLQQTNDAGKAWHPLKVPGTAYYPRSVQAADGRIFVFGHVGGDDAYGKVDQSIVMDSFRLVTK